MADKVGLGAQEELLRAVHSSPVLLRFFSDFSPFVSNCSPPIWTRILALYQGYKVEYLVTRVGFRFGRPKVVRMVTNRELFLFLTNPVTSHGGDAPCLAYERHPI